MVPVRSFVSFNPVGFLDATWCSSPDYSEVSTESQKPLTPLLLCLPLGIALGIASAACPDKKPETCCVSPGMNEDGGHFIGDLVLYKAGDEPLPADSVTRDPLVHGLYTPAQKILPAFKMWCAGKGQMDFKKFSWVGSEIPPANSGDPDVAVMLDVTLQTWPETVAFAWTYASDLDPKMGEVPNLNPDTRLAGFRPWTLQWRLVRFDPAQKSDLFDAASGEKLAMHSFFLYVAEHPSLLN